MMNRLPSLGFLYITGMISAFALGCWWLLQPHWYERTEPAASYARAHFMLDIAKAHEEPTRSKRIRSSIDRGLQTGRATDNWMYLLAVLEALDEGSLKLDGVSINHVGDAWLLSTQTANSGAPTEELLLLAHNPTSEPRTMDLLWSGNDQNTASVQSDDTTTTQLSFRNGTARQVLKGLPPGAPRMYSVRSPNLGDIDLLQAQTR